MEEKKIYVLIQDWNFGFGDADIEVRLFDSLSMAQEVMRKEANLWEKVAKTDDLTREEEEYRIEYYKPYEFDDNHMTWRIVDKEVEKSQTK